MNPYHGLGIAALSVAALVNDCHAQDRLELTEAASYPLPRSFFVSGVVADTGERILVWSEVDDRVLLLSGGSIQEVGDGRVKSPVAAAFGTGGAIEVVQREPGTVWRFENGGVKRSLLGFSPVRAVRLSDGWMLASVDTSISGPSLVLAYYSGFTGRWQPHHDWAFVPVRVQGADGMSNVPYLSGATGAVLVTERDSPFQITSVGLDGEISKFTGSSSSPSYTVTSSAPAFEVGSWVIQNLYDPRTEQKEVRLFGPDGSLRRVTPSTIPLILVAATKDGHSVLGIRALEQRELVVYSWHLERPTGVGLP